MIESITQLYLGRASGNSFLIKTDTGFVLVDSGMKNTSKKLDRLLAEQGCDQNNLQLLIFTHADFDHTGNAVHVRDTYNVKIAMHRLDVPIVESGNMFVNRRANVFMRWIINNIFGIRTFTPDILLDEETDLSPYGLDARIMHIPGHTSGSIALLTTEGDLICGDILLNNKQPGPTTLVDNVEQMEKSIERLKALNIRTVYPGHGTPFPMSAYTSCE